MAAERLDVVLEHVDGHITGALDGGDAGLGHTDALSKLTLGHAGLLTQGGEPGCEAQLVLDLTDTVLCPRCLEDHLLPLLETHRRFPLLFLLVLVAALVVFFSRLVVSSALVIVEPIVGDRDVGLVPSLPVVALVATDEEDRLTFEVEGEDDSDSVRPVEPGRSSFMLL